MYILTSHAVFVLYVAESVLESELCATEEDKRP
jgi:hypothetical protein